MNYNYLINRQPKWLQLHSTTSKFIDGVMQRHIILLNVIDTPYILLIFFLLKIDELFFNLSHCILIFMVSK